MDFFSFIRKIVHLLKLILFLTLRKCFKQELWFYSNILGLSYFLKKGTIWDHLTFVGTAGKTILGPHTHQIQACNILLWTAFFWVTALMSIELFLNEILWFKNISFVIHQFT